MNNGPGQNWKCQPGHRTSRRRRYAAAGVAVLWLLSIAVAPAAAQTALGIDSISSFNADTVPDPPTFTLPSSSNLSVSVAFCSSNSDSTPRFFVTNSSAVSTPSASGGDNVYEIDLTDGYGNFTGLFEEGGVLAVEDAGETTFEIGVSENGPIHQSLDQLPLLGDTTSNQAIIFSPTFELSGWAEPSYPNYTLPDANLTFTEPSSSSNFTIFLVETDTSGSLSSLPQTACVLASQTSAGTVTNESAWLRDDLGWRTQWIIEGLTPSTNYTAYVVRAGTQVSQPMYFATKSATFNCPLVSSLPFCPNIAYPVPLPFPESTTRYDASNIPDSITDPLLSSITNLTVSLTSFACGRDLYSPLVTCADCQREYRRWLCTVSFPRCGEASPSNPDAVTSAAPNPTATGIGAVTHHSKHNKDGAETSTVRSALVPQASGSAPRNSNFPTVDYPYSMLLPCLETCTAADRACPNFLGFKCPVMRFNAAASYGVGYVDSGKEDGEGDGAVSSLQDRYGNIWCNGG